MLIKTLSLGPLETNCYILGCEKTLEGVIIDPADDVHIILQTVTQLKLSIKYILLTHGHFDHCCGLPVLKEKINVPIALHRDDIPFVAHAKTHGKLYGFSVPDLPVPDTFIEEGDTFTFGTITLTAIHTPGHTPGGMCFYCAPYLFSGDTLFQRSIGRTDLPGGNSRQILDSIMNKLYKLDPATRVFTGHGPETTIGEEMQFNPFTS